MNPAKLKGSDGFAISPVLLDDRFRELQAMLRPSGDFFPGKDLTPEARSCRSHTRAKRRREKKTPGFCLQRKGQSVTYTTPRRSPAVQQPGIYYSYEGRKLSNIEGSTTAAAAKRAQEPLCLLRSASEVNASRAHRAC